MIKNLRDQQIGSIKKLVVVDNVLSVCIDIDSGGYRIIECTGTLI